VSSGAIGFAGRSPVYLQSMEANAIGTMVGDQGTVIDCRMLIQRGIRPHGIGRCLDDEGNEYTLQF